MSKRFDPKPIKPIQTITAERARTIYPVLGILNQCVIETEKGIGDPNQLQHVVRRILNTLKSEYALELTRIEKRDFIRVV